MFVGTKSRPRGDFQESCSYVCMYGHHIQQEKDQPCKIGNPARGQLNIPFVSFYQYYSSIYSYFVNIELYVLIYSEQS